MTNRTIICVVIGFLILAGTALAGLDQSGFQGAKNLSIADFSALGVEDTADKDIVSVGAPEVAAASPGTELAAYTDQAPPSANLGKLMPLSLTTNPPRYMYYNGDYLSWRDFSSTFSGNQPGLWIERAVSWSSYATLPLGGWARELLYVPTQTQLTMYEIYPGGYVMGYYLGFVQPGYYYVWYYADTLGRHRNVFSTTTGNSNAVIIDVYPIHYTPIKPDPKTECEKNPNCYWVNGNCYCTMPKPNPKTECEKNPNCYWVNGNCQCVMPDPERKKCESNPLCDYVDGQCYCRGFNPEPMPGPVPNPNPEPFNPAPNPVAECEQNPSCHWANGQCLCTGFNPIDSVQESDSTVTSGVAGSVSKT